MRLRSWDQETVNTSGHIIFNTNIWSSLSKMDALGSDIKCPCKSDVHRGVNRGREQL